MGEVGNLVVAAVASILVTAGLYALDERFLSDEAKERAWPRSTRWVAIVYFGLLAVPIHFWKTRRGWRKPVFAILGTVAALIGIELVGECLAWIVGRWE